jgi:hypothetical protein
MKQDNIELDRSCVDKKIVAVRPVLLKSNLIQWRVLIYVKSFRVIKLFLFYILGCPKEFV